MNSAATAAVHTDSGSSFTAVTDPVVTTTTRGETIASDLPFPRAKRVLDVVVATTLLVLSAPLYLAIALIVRSDRGPVFFTQRRVGAGGRTFELKKFRSMAADAEQRLHANPDLYAKYMANGFKLRPEEDPRFTRWGQFLRSSSLDELPQLVSVLKGDMSMVGPRPIVEPELEQYRCRNAAGAYLASRPGLTGLWQVSGRSLVGYEERVELDLQYVEQCTIADDIRILLRTPLVVLRRVGAH